MIPSHRSSAFQQPPASSLYGEARALTGPSVAQQRHGSDAAATTSSYATSTRIGLQPPATFNDPLRRSPYLPAQTAAATLSSSSSSSSPFAATSAAATATRSSNNQYYQHNTTALAFLLPPLLSLLWSHESPYPVQVFLFVTLTLYAMDLANMRQGVAIGVWIGAIVLVCVSGWFLLLDQGDDEDSGTFILSLIAQIGVNGLLFVCGACWCTLQLRWLHSGGDGTLSTAPLMESMLHALLPPVAAAVICFQLSRALIDAWGLDRGATLAPYLFAVLLASGMLWLGCNRSSFFHDDYNSSSSSSNKLGLVKFAISSTAARIHSILLLMVPPLMHVLMFRRRIMGSAAAMDDLYDLALVWAFPYLLHYVIHVLHQSGTWKGPYAMSNVLFPAVSGNNTLRGVLVPMAVSLVASLAMQQRYLIPMCHTVAYQFKGHLLSSNWLVSTFLSLATLSSLFAIWVWGRRSALTGEALFGEYHEDVVQLSLALGGFLVGKAFGMPWNLTPLPILAFLGLSVWATTRMLRYLAIFLFVLHAAGMVLLSYRFAGIDSKIALALPWFEIGLIRFGTIIIFASILIGFVMGLSVRSSGGLGSSILKRVDLAGILLIIYSFLLTILEITLLKRPIPFQELEGTELEADDSSSTETIYDHTTALLTSVMLIGVTIYMQRFNIVSKHCASIAISAALGKLLVVFVDMCVVDSGQDASNEVSAPKMLFQMVVATLLLLVIISPRTFLKPVHIKTPAARYNNANGQSSSNLPFEIDFKIWAYALVLLPLALIVSIPYVLLPLSEVVAGHFGGAYYSVAPSMSEVAGLALALWGLSCLSMLSHLLPDAGGEGWKKASALTFLVGIGLSLSAPTLPTWIGLDANSASLNPFAAISSLGYQLVARDRGKIGGWGLLSAAFATLLAVTGPLELRERRHPSGRKDNLLMLRMMIFSILFGCGVAWFITILNMSEERIAVLLVTSIGCMAISFFGTVASVLGYFIEVENFEEVEQLVLVWALALPVFALISGIPQFMLGDAAHAFGTGGWLSTYLAVSGSTALGFAMVLRSRPIKNTTSRGAANLACIMAWLSMIAVLYGQYGVAGLDGAFDVTRILWIPASVMGTLLLSPILLALEGETSNSERRGRVQRVVTTTPSKPSQTPLHWTFPNLGRSNRFAPLYTSTIVVFLVASLYAILLRGSGWFFFGVRSTPTNHEDVFTSIFGSSAGAGEGVGGLAQRTVLSSQALRTSARLAATGLWTTGNVLIPFLHLLGVVATMPSLYSIHAHLWSGQRPAMSTTVIIAVPLNLLPLIMCWGIPTLLAAAIAGIIGSVLQLVQLQQHHRQSQMRI